MHNLPFITPPSTQSPPTICEESRVPLALSFALQGDLGLSPGCALYAWVKKPLLLARVSECCAPSTVPDAARVVVDDS